MQTLVGVKWHGLERFFFQSSANIDLLRATMQIFFCRFIEFYEIYVTARDREKERGRAENFSPRELRYPQKPKYFTSRASESGLMLLVE